MKLLCLVGRSGVGKTTLLEQAVRTLGSQGLKILAVKSSHHRFPDQDGTDSHRLAQAGAAGVALLGACGSQLYLDPPLTLEEMLSALCQRFDVALIEGGKSSRFPKVELLGEEPPLLEADKVVAYLRRGQDPGGPQPVQRLLELLEEHHFEVGPP